MQRLKIGPLDSGKWPVELLTEGAASLAQGTIVAADVKTVAKAAWATLDDTTRVGELADRGNEIRALLPDAVSDALSRPGILLDLDPEFPALPWELIVGGEFEYAPADIGHSPEIVHLRCRGPIDEGAGWPIKVLVVIALRTQDGTQEAKLAASETIHVPSYLYAATKDQKWSARRNDVEVEVALNPSDLPALLRQHQPHVLHLVCHGKRGADGKAQLYIFDGKSNSKKPVTAQDIRLNWGCTPRFVFLNACQAGDPRAIKGHSIVDALLGQGTQVVLAMQTEIWHDTAQRLTQGFYAALADGHSVLDAIRKARSQALSPDSREGWAPRLTVTDPKLLGPVVADPPGGDVVRASVDEKEQFRCLRGFVGRTGLRRRLWEARDQPFTLVSGPEKSGKTWLTRLACERCALAGEVVHYVEMDPTRPLDEIGFIQAVAGETPPGASLALAGRAASDIFEPLRRLFGGPRAAIPSSFEGCRDLETDGDARNEVFNTFIKCLADAFPGASTGDPPGSPPLRVLRLVIDGAQQLIDRVHTGLLANEVFRMASESGQAIRVVLVVRGERANLLSGYAHHIRVPDSLSEQLDGAAAHGLVQQMGRQLFKLFPSTIPRPGHPPTFDLINNTGNMVRALVEQRLPVPMDQLALAQKFLATVDTAHFLDVTK